MTEATSTDPAPLPPAGWYPAPDGSSGRWWWDGAQWVPGHDGGLPAPTGVVSKLAVATQLLLAGSAVVAVAAIANELAGIGAATAYLGGDESAYDGLTRYDQGTMVVSILSSLSLVVTGVLWAVWQFQVAKRVPGRTRRSPGWHAGSWFIPFVYLWFPYQNISDLWRAVGRVRPPWAIVWWLLWIVSNLVVNVSTRVYLVSESLEQFLVSMWANLIGQALLLVAAPLALLTVRGITNGLVSRSAEPVAAEGSPA